MAAPHSSQPEFDVSTEFVMAWSTFRGAHECDLVDEWK